MRLAGTFLDNKPHGILVESNIKGENRIEYECRRDDFHGKRTAYVFGRIENELFLYNVKVQD